MIIYSFIRDAKLLEKVANDIKEVSPDEFIEIRDSLSSVLTEVESQKLVFLFMTPNKLSKADTELFFFKDDVPRAVAIFFNSEGDTSDYREELEIVLKQKVALNNNAKSVIIKDSVSTVPQDVYCTYLEAAGKAGYQVKEDCEDFFIVLSYIDDSDILFESNPEIQDIATAGLDKSKMRALIILRDKDINDEVYKLILSSEDYIILRLKQNNTILLETTPLEEFQKLLDKINKG